MISPRGHSADGSRRRRRGHSETGARLLRYRDEIDGVVSRFSDLSPSLDGNIIAWSATPHNSLAMRRQTSDQTLDRSRADSSPIFTPAAPDGPVGLPL